jgi:hypothetical protein
MAKAQVQVRYTPVPARLNPFLYVHVMNCREKIREDELGSVNTEKSNSQWKNIKHTKWQCQEKGSSEGRCR